MTGDAISPSLLYLAQLTREVPSRAVLDALAQPDEDTLLALARRHRVMALAAAGIAVAGHQISGEAASRLDKAQRRIAMRSLPARSAFARIHEAFGKTGIDCLLMKGDAVALRFYETPALRQSIDIDILVAEEQAGPAEQVLAACGFVPDPGDRNIPAQTLSLYRQLRADSSHTRAEARVTVELHWRFAANPHLLPWTMKSIETHTEQMDMAGCQVRVLIPEAQFVYLVAHGCKHAWFRLKWLCDLDRIWTRLSPEERKTARAMAREAGLQPAWEASLALLGEVFGLETGERSQSEKSRKLLGYMRAALDDPADVTGVRLGDSARLARELRYELSLKDGWPYRRAALVKRLVDMRTVRALKRGRSWLPVYVILSPAMALWRVVRRSLGG